MVMACLAAIPAVAQESEECVRIFYGEDSEGQPAIVLTNLDEDGKQRPSCYDDTPWPASPPRPLPPAVPPSDEDETDTVDVQVTGGALPDGSQIEVKTGDAGGTTIIININQPPPPPPAAEPTPQVVVVRTLGYAAFGGVPGPIRYPENHRFLGYGDDTSSPSWFGGLALNAGNQFGLSVGQQCGVGFNCMFGPKLQRP